MPLDMFTIGKKTHAMINNEVKNEPVRVNVVPEPKDEKHVYRNTADNDDQNSVHSYPHDDSTIDEDSYIDAGTEVDCGGPNCEENPHFERYCSCIAPSIASSDLHTIEEEWGSPPSENTISDDYTSNFISEDESFTTDEESERYVSHYREEEEGSDHYENFEMVLQDEELVGPMKDRLQDTLTHRKRAMEVEKEDKRLKALRNRLLAKKLDPDASIKDDVFYMPYDDEGIEAKPKKKNTQSSKQSSKSILQRLFRGKDMAQEKREQTQVNQSNPKRVGVPKKSSKDEWKAAIQHDTGRIYYYHSKTRETTWIRPESFVLWKMGMDTTLNRPYFYNQITKETSWEVPPDFDPWKSYVDANTGKTYYHNVLTRETTWSKTKAKPVQETTMSRIKNEILQNEELTATIVTSPSLIDDNLGVRVSDENDLRPSVSPSRATNPNSKVKEQESQTSPAAISNSSSESYSSESQDDPDWDKTGYEYQSDPDEKAGKGKEDLVGIEDVLETESKERVRLKSLLLTYAPANAEMNAALLNHFQGNEHFAITKVETILDDTPFDEIHTAMYNYACSVLNQKISKSNQVNTEQNESDMSGYKQNTPSLSARTERSERVRSASRSQSNPSLMPGTKNKQRFDSKSESDSSSRSDNRELEMSVLWPGGSTPTSHVTESASGGHNKHVDGLNRLGSKVPTGTREKNRNSNSKEADSSGKEPDYVVDVTIYRREIY